MDRAPAPKRRCRKLTPAEKRAAWSPPSSNAGVGWDRRRPSGFPGDVRGLADCEAAISADLAEGLDDPSALDFLDEGDA